MGSFSAISAISAISANTPYLKKLKLYAIFLTKRALLETTQTEMEPQTKKQEHKSDKEKKNGGNRLGSGKGTRVKEENQSRGKKGKKHVSIASGF